MVNEFHDPKRRFPTKLTSISVQQSPQAPSDDTWRDPEGIVTGAAVFTRQRMADNRYKPEHFAEAAWDETYYLMDPA